MKEVGGGDSESFEYVNVVYLVYDLIVKTIYRTDETPVPKQLCRQDFLKENYLKNTHTPLV